METLQVHRQQPGERVFDGHHASNVKFFETPPGAAVYAASEGLSTLVLDGVGPGGQAGSSSKIENYAGFPNGIPGRDLAQLSYLQALKFGAEFAAPCHVTELGRTPDGLHRVRTAEGDTATARTVIVATGVSYRLLRVEGLDGLRGSGVYYSVTAVEALLCKQCPVHVVGAGNSAGQAAMFLSRYAREVSLVVRGGDLQKSMSSYLSERVLANPQIKVRYHTEVAAVEGIDRLHAVQLRDGQGGESREDTASSSSSARSRTRISCRPRCCATTRDSC